MTGVLAKREHIEGRIRFPAGFRYTCTHRGGPLSEGEVEGHVVTCPWHGAKFDITSGEVLGPPAPAGVASYPTRVNGSDIEVEL